MTHRPAAVCALSAAAALAFPVAASRYDPTVATCCRTFAHLWHHPDPKLRLPARTAAVVAVGHLYLVTRNHRRNQ